MSRGPKFSDEREVHSELSFRRSFDYLSWAPIKFGRVNDAIADFEVHHAFPLSGGN
jgi:hypothetical protein